MTAPPTLYLLADTNLFLQARPLKDLDWSRFGSPVIEIVISRPVQAELDQQKKAPGRVGKRARDANTLLRALLDGPQEVHAMNPAVHVVLRDELRVDPTLDDELDYAERDDQLVGIAAGFAKTKPTGAVRVLTHDNGPMAS